MLEIKFDIKRLNLVWKYSENTNDITVKPTDITSPQNTKKFVEAVFSSLCLLFVVFKSFLVARHITPKFSTLQIKNTASTFNGDNVPETIRAIPVKKMETNEDMLQNSILLKTILFGEIGNVLRRLKNLPSLEILFAQKEFKIIENIDTAHKTISKSQLSRVNSFIIEQSRLEVITTISGSVKTIAK